MLNLRSAASLAAFCFATAAPLQVAAEVDLVPESKKPDFAYGDWKAAGAAATSRTVAIGGLGAKGGFGWQLPAGVAHDGGAFPALQMTVNPGNQASVVFVLIKDADGTLNKYEMPVPGARAPTASPPLPGPRSPSRPRSIPPATPPGWTFPRSIRCKSSATGRLRPLT